jgi:hypothetical protein
VLPSVWSASFAVWIRTGKQFMGAGVNKLIIAAKVGLVSKRKGRQSFVVSGYQDRIYEENSKLLIWLHVKDKCCNCQGQLKTNLQDEILSKTDNSCIPKLTRIKFKVKLYNCRK